MKPYLIKRLDEYYKLEGFNAVWIGLFGLYLTIHFGWRSSLLLSYGLLLVVFILVQGTYYWKLKLARLQGVALRDEQLLARFRLYYWSNTGLIVLYPMLIALALVYEPHLLATQTNVAWAVFAYLFGVAEHLNYYHVQLMYDNAHDWQYLARHKRLKPASLWKDLQENKI